MKYTAEWPYAYINTCWDHLNFTLSYYSTIQKAVPDLRCAYHASAGLQPTVDLPEASLVVVHMIGIERVIQLCDRTIPEYYYIDNIPMLFQFPLMNKM